MIKINGEKYCIFTTCGKKKEKLEEGEKIPLYLMYKGLSSTERINFIKTVLKEEKFWFVTPSGPGIIPFDYQSEYYMAVTPTKKLKDPEFQKMHREKALKISPDLNDYDGIFFLGADKYFPFLQKVFYDKKVEKFFNRKLSIGFLISSLRKIEVYEEPLTSFKYLPLKNDCGIAEYTKGKYIFKNLFKKNENKYILDNFFVKLNPLIKKLKKENKYDFIDLTKDLNKIEVDLRFKEILKEILNSKLYYYLFENKNRRENE